jgi:GTP-binding protein
MNYNNADFFASYGLTKQIPPSEQSEIVFCGRSNVGKSTLINKVFNRKNLARTSSTPGKTATINFYKCEKLFFVDLPGYGYAKTNKNEQRRLSELLDGYFAQKRNISRVFLLVDIRRLDNFFNKDNLDNIMLEYLKSKKLPVTLVFTKADKLNQTEKTEALYVMKNITDDYILFSALKNLGIVELKQIVEKTYEQSIS